jgi:hypothetical protein
MARSTWVMMAIASAVTVVAAACAGEEEVPIPPECNGAVELCERRFDEVSYPATHNAMASEADGFVGPNQHFGIQRQLEDGIRAMLLDSYDFEGDTYLCHIFCQAGKLRMVDALTTIRKFLEKNRGEVLTFILESHITGAQTADAFEDSGLDKYVHVQIPGEPWPTLREMIDADKRLVVFTEAGGGDPDWFMDVWAHTWETNFHFEELSQFSCAINRGVAGHPLFLLNHFLTRVYGVPELAEAVNGTFLTDRARQCQQESGRLPNFVTVDFYSIGSVFETTRMLNKLP